MRTKRPWPVWMLREGHLVAGMIALIVGAGFIYTSYLGATLRYPDEYEYVTLALNLLRFHSLTFDGIHPTAFRPPGYPFVLALVYAIFPSIAILRSVKFILLGLSMLLVYRIVRRHSSGTGGVVGTLLVMLYPVLFYTAGTFYPQTLGGTLLLIAVGLVAYETRAWWRVVLAGLTFGALILTIPALSIALIVSVGWAWWARPKQRWGAIVILGIALGMAGAWTVRNAYIFGSPAFVSSNAGYNLLLGNVEGATPNSGVNVDISKYIVVGEQMGEVERDQYYRSQVIAFVQAHPQQALKLYVLKVLNYFNYRNDLWNSAESSTLRDGIMLMSYGGLLLIAVLRLISIRKAPLTRFEWLLLLLYGADALVSAVFITRIRLRLSADYLLIMFDAIFLGLYLERRLLPMVWHQHRESA